MFLLEHFTGIRLTSRGTAPPLCGGEELTCTCRSLPPVASHLDQRSEPWGETRLCCYLQHLNQSSFVLCAPVELKLWTHQILMNELFKMKIFTDILCCERNDMRTISGNWNHQPTEGWIQKSHRNITGWSNLCVNFITGTHNVTQECMGAVWACSWWVSGWCPGWSPPDLDQGISDLWTVCGVTWQWYITSRRCSIWFRWGEQEGQSTTVRELLTMTWRSVWATTETPPQTITDTSNRSCLQAAWRHHGISRLSHVLSVNLLSSVERTGSQWQTCKLWFSIANAGLWSCHSHGVSSPPAD